MAELSEKQIDNYMDDLIKTINQLQTTIEKEREDFKILYVRMTKAEYRLNQAEESAVYWQNLHDKTVTELHVKLDDANELLNQRYIDEKGTVWTIPTPEAYAIVCKQVEYLKQDLAISEDFGKEQTAEVKKLVEENLELKKVVDATFLYMKHINSPLCLGWDNLIDAIQGWRNYIDERGKNNESK